MDSDYNNTCINDSDNLNSVGIHSGDEIIFKCQECEKTEEITVKKCVAKPVIYLYPRKIENVCITLKNCNSITVSYPVYSENGWNVIAYPDGKITDLKGMYEYSYLFWEGCGQKHYGIQQGDVVHRSVLIDFLRNKLSSFGLLPKEYNEFIVYWYPILCKNEYNAISFFCDEYENDYELYIAPKPDEILRIFMVYEKADKDTVLTPPDDVKTITRKGFTVIEWGGQLQK